MVNLPNCSINPSSSTKIQLSTTVSILPNPSSAEVKIISSEKIISINIFDSRGMAIIKAKNIQATSFLASLDVKGIYFAQVITENNLEVKKIIIE